MDKYKIFDHEKHITNLWNTEGHFNNQRLNRYIETIKDNIEFEKGTVLEVGPGTGSLAKHIIENYLVDKYYILDIEKNINSVKDKLSEFNNVEYILSQDYKKVFDLDIDFFISILCLSEVPDYYREDIANNIFNKCKYAFVIDGDLKHPTFNGWLITTFRNNFKFTNKIHFENKNLFTIIGKN